jgi:hypothetical protein
MKLRPLIVAGLIALSASTLALAGNYANVWDNYQPQARFWESLNYFQMYNPAQGELNDNDSTTWYVTLQAGRSYRIFGVCDGDCNDLDLELYDAYGNSVDYDRHSDDTPYVSVTPRYTQRYSFVVKMHDCWVYTCSYMVGIYGR